MKRAVGLLAGVAVLAGSLAACGDDERQLVGYVTEPARQVDVAELPDVSDDGEPFRFVAPSDGLLLVYFGYTNCPDACPNTMGEVKRALEDEMGDDADRISVAMVTVDPEHDSEILTEYVQSFVPDAHAIATDDMTMLRRVAAAFDASFSEARVTPSGVRVDHSVLLYAVDDHGRLAITWPLDTKADDLAADMRQLLDE